MPSSIGHAFAAIAVGTALAPRTTGARYWLAGILSAVLVDIDAIGRPFGLGDLSLLGGHRALTHSLPFAVVLGGVVAWLGFRVPPWQESRMRITLYLVLATASHGLLDLFASYGGGVTLFYPFSTERYASPWRPLKALNEVWWVWLPALILSLIVWRMRASARSK